MARPGDDRRPAGLPSMLSVDSLRFHRGAVPVIENLSLACGAGEVFVLLGPSGSAKTTLLRLIAGLELPDDGEIRIGGRLASTPSYLLPPHRRCVGMVFQDLALWPHMTIKQHLDFVLRTSERSGEKRSRRIWELLDIVRLPKPHNCYPHELSGGERQRLALARALAGDPRVLLLDEPLANLDRRLRRMLLKEINDLSRQLGTTIIYVTHDLWEAQHLDSRVAVLVDGSIEAIGTLPELIKSGESRFLSEMALVY